MANDTPSIELTLISEDDKNEIILKTENGSLTFPKEDLALHLDMTVQHHQHSREGALSPLVIHYLAPDEDNILRKLGTGFWKAGLSHDGNVSLQPDLQAVMAHGTSPILSGIAHAVRAPYPLVYPGLTRDSIHEFSSIKKYAQGMMTLPASTGSTQQAVNQENQALSEALATIGAEFVMSGKHIFPFDAESKTFREPTQPRSNALYGYPADQLRVIESEPRVDDFKVLLSDAGIPRAIIERITNTDPNFPVSVTPSDIGALPEEMHQELAFKLRYQAVHQLGQNLLVDYSPGSTDIANRLQDALEEEFMYLDENTIPFYAESVLVALGAGYSEELRADCQSIAFDEQIYKSLEEALNHHYFPDPLEPSVKPGMR